MGKDPLAGDHALLAAKHIAAEAGVYESTIQLTDRMIAAAAGGELK